MITKGNRQKGGAELTLPSFFDNNSDSILFCEDHTYYLSLPLTRYARVHGIRQTGMMHDLHTPHFARFVWFRIFSID